jgi:hypothetical protein
MAEPVQLHPRVRERPEPRISASALAEFIITPPDRQDEVLHDARFMRAPAVIPYGDAIRAIKAFCGDPARKASHLDAAVAALEAKSRSDDHSPSIRDEARRSIEAIGLFQAGSNAFGLGRLPLLVPSRMDLVEIAGTRVSVQPDLIVGTAYPALEGKIGGAFVRAQKRPDPHACKTEGTRNERAELRRETAAYMLTLLRMALVAAGTPESSINPKWIFCLDLRLGERIDFPSDRVSRERRIKAACGQISRLWGSVAPKPGDLDPDR